MMKHLMLTVGATTPGSPSRADELKVSETARVLSARGLLVCLHSVSARANYLFETRMTAKGESREWRCSVVLVG